MSKKVHLFSYALLFVFAFQAGQPWCACFADDGPGIDSTTTISLEEEDFSEEEAWSASRVSFNRPFLISPTYREPALGAPAALDRSQIYLLKHTFLV